MGTPAAIAGLDMTPDGRFVAVSMPDTESIAMFVIAPALAAAGARLAVPGPSSLWCGWPSSVLVAIALGGRKPEHSSKQRCRSK